MLRFHLASFILAAGLIFAAADAARAQGDEPRWEVGGQLTGFNVTNGSATATNIVICVQAPCPPVITTAELRATELGFGGRVGYGLGRHVTLEAEGNFFPRDGSVSSDEFTGGRKVQGLLGVKAGRRFEQVGVFAKARPGFVHFDAGDLEQVGACVAIFPPPLGCFETRGRTDFAFDLGGVVELYPSSRTIIRFDVGDTVLRSGSHNVPVRTPVFDVAVPVPDRTTHNFQGSVGFGFRF
jgi:hypothetical protein